MRGMVVAVVVGDKEDNIGTLHGTTLQIGMCCRRKGMINRWLSSLVTSAQNEKNEKKLNGNGREDI